MHLSSLLEPKTYRDDETVGIAAAPANIPFEAIPELEWRFVSERLFARLLLVGSAYSMHFADLLDGERDAKLNADQCERVIEEVLMLREIIGDEALAIAIDSLVSKSESVVRAPHCFLRVSHP